MCKQEKLSRALEELQTTGFVVLDDKESSRLCITKDGEFFEVSELFYYFDEEGNPFIDQDEVVPRLLGYHKVVVEIEDFLDQKELLEAF